MRRIVVGAAAFLMALAPSSPALAHGGGSPDATNFASRVTGLVAVDAEDEPQGPADLAGVRWRVLANDTLLQVINRSGEDLTVPGYGGEPYLRVRPGGVWENRNSPAAYLNTDRYAGAPVPETASVTARPKWVRVAERPIYAWHDHRVHWMSPTPPPQVAAAGGERIKIFDWAVPFTLGDRRLAVTGTLRWIPGPKASPWLLGAAVVTTLPLLLALRRRAGPERRRALLRAGAAVLAAVILIDLVHSIDDVLAMPATLGQNLWSFGQSAFFLGIGALGALVAWRGEDAARAALTFGAAFGISLGIGISHAFTLASSQIATTLPVAFSRAAVAASLMVAVPAALAALLAGKPPASPRIESAPAP